MIKLLLVSALICGYSAIQLPEFRLPSKDELEVQLKKILRDGFKGSTDPEIDMNFVSFQQLHPFLSSSWLCVKQKLTFMILCPE